MKTLIFSFTIGLAVFAPPAGAQPDERRAPARAMFTVPGVARYEGESAVEPEPGPASQSPSQPELVPASLAPSVLQATTAPPVEPFTAPALPAAPPTEPLSAPALPAAPSAPALPAAPPTEPLSTPALPAAPSAPSAPALPAAPLTEPLTAAPAPGVAPLETAVSTHGALS